MKKLILLLSAAGLITAASYAQSTADIVGFSRSQPPTAGDMKILSVFHFLRGTNETADIQDIFENISDLNAGGKLAQKQRGDRLMVWDGLVYQTYRLYSGTGNGPYWALENDPKWINPLPTMHPEEVHVTLKRGDSLWFVTGSEDSAQSLVFSGIVPDTNDYSVSLTDGGMTLIAYPFPTTVNLSNLVISGASVGGKLAQKQLADKIIVWDGSIYQTYTLYQGSGSGPYWARDNDPRWTNPLPTMHPEKVDVEINLGDGFWYQTPDIPQNKTITFSANYHL